MKKVKVAMGTLLIVLATFSFLYLQGCNKQGEKISENTTEDTQANALTESDADLVNVDYKDFYDALAPKGEWIEVTPDELGIKANTTSDIEHPSKSMLFSEVFGVNSAYAQDVAAGAFFVWKPAPDLALGVSAGAPSLATPLVTTEVVTTTVAPAMYVPYTNGSWVNTDNGWYFQAVTPEEEIVHHYGRWEYSPTLGWVWLPGKVWSPAWVDWRQDDNYVSWAPLPYSTVVVNNVVPEVVIPAERYVIIQQPHFLEPIYSYRVIAPEPVIIVGKMKRLKGLVVVNNVLVDRGPDIVYVEKITGKKAFLYPINRVTTFRDVRFRDNVIYTYSPVLIREKNKVVFKPARFTPFHDAKVKFDNRNADWNKKQEEKSKQDLIKQENKGNDKKHEVKENKKNDQIKHEQKKGNDNKMPVYKNNEKKHDSPKKENPKKESPKKENPKKSSNDSKPQVKGNEKHDDHSKKGNDKGGDHGKKGKK